MYHRCPRSAQHLRSLALYCKQQLKAPLRQTLQARLPGCLSNVTQDESIC